MIHPDQLNANGRRILTGLILFGAKSKVDIGVSDIFYFFSLTHRIEQVVINKSEKKKDVDGEKKNVRGEKKNGGGESVVVDSTICYFSGSWKCTMAAVHRFLI